MLQQRCLYVLSGLVCFSKSKLKMFHFINRNYGFKLHISFSMCRI